MDLAGIFTGALTWRRLAVLLRQLPAGSRLARATDPRLAWTQQEQLTAQAADNAALIADEVGLLRWTYASVNARKGRRPARPDPYPRIPRPGQAPARPAQPSRRLRPAAAARRLMAAAKGAG